jgi:hypothetical protein
MAFCAAALSFQNFGSSAFAFSSSRRLRAASGSKMPPQQRQRLLDLLGDGLHFGAHVRFRPRVKGATYNVAPPFVSRQIQ